MDTNSTQKIVSEEIISDFVRDYFPLGDIADFPKEIIVAMLEWQTMQEYKFDISIFENDRLSGAYNYLPGFQWSETLEGFEFWHDVIFYKEFEVFFDLYPDKKFEYTKPDIIK
ncbi:hypothetical protein LPB90_18160 [Chryseobacterium sp. LC2016-29]|uniref:hypothetical protein n=1 Tax=Chryseobacterium sp. LC2016-29 TaxID=2897331 RepID=UPI001E300B73|nr:hypothetical protein [Chryseobacterium sp. LC2016-29]MCD0480366.1 hypothetical protein [Chryseobacterium sp. LC2016-29]